MFGEKWDDDTSRFSSCGVCNSNIVGSTRQSLRAPISVTSKELPALSVMCPYALRRCLRCGSSTRYAGKSSKTIACSWLCTVVLCWQESACAILLLPFLRFLPGVLRSPSATPCSGLVTWCVVTSGAASTFFPAKSSVKDIRKAMIPLGMVSALSTFLSLEYRSLSLSTTKKFWSNFYTNHWRGKTLGKLSLENAFLSGKSNGLRSSEPSPSTFAGWRSEFALRTKCNVGCQWRRSTRAARHWRLRPPRLGRPSCGRAGVKWCK